MTQKFIKDFNEANENMTQSHAGGFKAEVRRKFLKFRKDDDGSLIIFGLYMFICMMVISGMAIDAMRSEEQRTRIQYTTDRALLAAAAMNQPLGAQDIFDDYFAKAGMEGMAPTATVINGMNSRKVSAEYAPADVPEIDTIFMSKSFRELLKTSEGDDAGGVDKLQTIASGVAVDGVEKVEISLVLDVSGSMGSTSQSGQRKIEDLQDAAKEFVDTLLLDQPSEDTYSISIVPYSTQVTVGNTILQHYNVTTEHDDSHCVDFTAGSFNSAAVSPLTELQRTGHFSPTTSSNYRPPSASSRACFTDSKREILPLSGDRTQLHDFIDDLYARGWTSTEIGIKWGAALLDPSARSVVTGLITDGDVSDKFAGRPFDYTEENVLKVIVVMTDGSNTNQYLLNDSVKSGLSPVWYKQDSNDDDRYWVRNEDRAGNQYRRLFYYENSSSRFRSMKWKASPGNGSTQLTWPELWAHAPMKFVGDMLFEEAYMDFANWHSYGWNGFFSRVTGGEKDIRMDNICTAVKDNDTLVFTIGFEVSDWNATKLSNCATSAGHFFRVEGVEISEAFASIAAQLHRLRLEQ
ncbi:pilus assembly protein TadG-related protein [Profundibacter sp.]